MKKTIVYVDGYNLYYGLLKNTPYKWLDLVALSKSMLNDSHDIAEVQYYTSIVKPEPYDAASVERQNVYLQALSAIPLVNIKLGFYSKHAVLVPPKSKKCVSCDESKNGYVRVWKLEEKRSDVNLAIEAVSDAALCREDAFVLITGDSDQTGTVEKIRRTFHKPAIVFDPHANPSLHLKRAATFYKNIPRDLPARCQLPDTVINARGNAVRRPDAWR